jgi:phosphate transport system substrate-binding protein
MNRLSTLGVVLLASVLFASCSRSEQSAQTANTASGVQINGAGSTFVNPIMSKWASDYAEANPKVHVNYTAIGSGAGIQQVTQGTIDFGATDGPMTDQQLAASKVGRIIHVPVIMGATVAAYNLPGFTGELKLTPAALAGIFLGTITKWNDPAIAKANPGAHLPATNILVVHRSDGSGTTYIWTDYLSKVSSEWKSKVGNNTSVSWPGGVGAKGNDGVAGMVRQTPGALGYVEMTYADQNNIPYASIQNAAGNFIRPTPEGVTAAAESADVPGDFRYSLTNAPGPNAYPIAGTTWLLLPVQARDKARGAALLEFTKWVLGPGQGFAPALHYAPLPASLTARVQQSLGTVQ